MRAPCDRGPQGQPLLLAVKKAPIEERPLHLSASCLQTRSVSLCLMLWPDSALSYFCRQTNIKVYTTLNNSFPSALCVEPVDLWM